MNDNDENIHIFMYIYIISIKKRIEAFSTKSDQSSPPRKAKGGVCSCVRHLVKLLLFPFFLLMIMIALYTIVLKIYIITALDNKIWSYFVDISSISNRQWTITPKNSLKLVQISSSYTYVKIGVWVIENERKQYMLASSSHLIQWNIIAK